MKKIVLDAGHGCDDPGAISGKLKEKNINLSITRFILAHLIEFDDHHILKSQSYPHTNGIQLNYPTTMRYEHNDLQILFTRISDRALTLQNRVHMANLFEADIFISIHCNSSKNKIPRGTQVYYWHTSEEGRKLAITIFGNIDYHSDKFTGYKNTKWSGIRENDNFYVLKNTEMPSILIELEFLSNPHGKLMLCLPENHNAFGETIASGIKEYLNDWNY